MSNHRVRVEVALTEWRRAIGESAVLETATARALYAAATDSIERRIPAALKPKTTEEIIEIVAIAEQHGVALYPISTGNNWGYGSANPPTDDTVIVDLSGMKQIIAFDAEMGTVTVQPGVTQQDLRNYLDRHNLPFLVPTTGAGPLMGNALERGYGMTPYADHFSAVMALEAVLPGGRLYRSPFAEMGGGAVNDAFKWGIGPYLEGLFAQGSVGIVTQMTIALAPEPEAFEAVYFWIKDEADLERAVTTVRHILNTVGGITGSINLMNRLRVLAMMVPYPEGEAAASSGALPPEVVARLGKRHDIAAWTGVGTMYGDKRVVAATRAVIKQALKPLASRVLFLSPRLVRGLKKVTSWMPERGRKRFSGLFDTLDSSLQLLGGRPSEVALRLAYWRSGKSPGPGERINPARDGCGLI